MDMGIKDRIALVLGAGGGLGSAISVALAREGVQVAGGDVNPAALEQTAARVAKDGGRFLPITVDLANLESIDEAVATVRAQLGEVSILVNNTGGPPPSTVGGVPAQVWGEHFESMVLSVLHVTDLVLPAMRAQGWGRVITSTSSGVVTPIANLGVSNTLRAALLGWSKSLANEVARDGVTSNIVLPGRIATDRIVSLDHAKAERDGVPVEQIAAASAASIPVGRYGRPEEYGDTVAFLASARSSFINGSVIRVDGGMIPSI
jgi:3-oxoacyl-[acyl-carrier protein] reductase